MKTHLGANLSVSDFRLGNGKGTRVRSGLGNVDRETHLEVCATDSSLVRTLAMVYGNLIVKILIFGCGALAFYVIRVGWACGPERGLTCKITPSSTNEVVMTSAARGRGVLLTRGSPLQR